MQKSQKVVKNYRVWSDTRGLQKTPAKLIQVHISKSHTLFYLTFVSKVRIRLILHEILQPGPCLKNCLFATATHVFKEWVVRSGILFFFGKLRVASPIFKVKR